MRNKIQILIGGMLALGLLNSCYPDDYGSIDDYTIVHTDYNVDYEFAGKGRIYMPDTIAFSTNIDEDDLEDFERWENMILDEVGLLVEERG